MREKQWKVTRGRAGGRDHGRADVPFELLELPRVRQPAVAAPVEVEAPPWTATLAEPARRAALPRSRTGIVTAPSPP